MFLVVTHVPQKAHIGRLAGPGLGCNEGLQLLAGLAFSNDQQFQPWLARHSADQCLKTFVVGEAPDRQQAQCAAIFG